MHDIFWVLWFFSFVVLTIPGIKTGITGLQWIMLVRSAHILWIFLFVHLTLLWIFVWHSWGDFLWLWLLVQLCHVGGKTPVRKRLAVDYDSDMVDVGRSKSGTVPMTFGLPRWVISGIQLLQKENHRITVWLVLKDTILKIIYFQLPCHIKGCWKTHPIWPWTVTVPVPVPYQPLSKEFSFS